MCHALQGPAGQCWSQRRPIQYLLCKKTQDVQSQLQPGKQCPKVQERAGGENKRKTMACTKVMESIHVVVWFGHQSCSKRCNQSCNEIGTPKLQPKLQSKWSTKVATKVAAKVEHQRCNQSCNQSGKPKLQPHLQSKLNSKGTFKPQSEAQLKGQF